MTYEQFIEYFEKLLDPGFTPPADPAITALYAELVASHPELDDAFAMGGEEAAERCPWSGPIERSDGHLIVSCVWDRDDEVCAILQDLAERHGLADHDRRSETVRYPAEPTHTPPRGAAPQRPRRKRF